MLQNKYYLLHKVVHFDNAYNNSSSVYAQNQTWYLQTKKKNELVILSVFARVE
jgi:hypothetical protein